MFIQSPNFSSRNGVAIRRIILHYTTSANVHGSISWFKKPESQVSAHYIVDKNGDIYQMVADSDKAWHAFGENADSIGIEHVARPGEMLTLAQEQATVQLIQWLLAEYKLPKEQITAHRFTPHNRTRTDCPHSLFGARTEEALRVWVDRHFS
jgi:N-acetyl-anhydromuramyl-L-alanine amidase AmpD